MEQGLADQIVQRENKVLVSPMKGNTKPPITSSTMLTSAFAPSGRKPNVKVPVAPSAIDYAIDIMPSLEGKKAHTDMVGIKTAPLGLVIDEKKNPSAYRANKKIADSLGIAFDSTLNEDDAKKIVRGVLATNDAVLSKSIPSYAALQPKHKAIVLDAKYNTGVNFANLAKALSDYEGNPTEELKAKIVAESRRSSKGKYVPGLDNRVAKLLHSKGIIADLREAQKYGLGLADTNEIPKGEQAGYKMQKDDTLYRVSRNSGVSVEDLIRLNNIKDFTSIPVGSELKLK